MSAWPCLSAEELYLLGRGQVYCATPTPLETYTSWMQMTKALQVRGHPSAQSFTDRLVELFDDVDVGWDAARAIGQVVRTDKILIKKNHAVIKVLSVPPSLNKMMTLLDSSCMPRNSRTSCSLASSKAQRRHPVRAHYPAPRVAALTSSLSCRTPPAKRLSRRSHFAHQVDPEDGLSA